MKKRIAVALAILFCLLTAHVLSDVGNFNSYDSSSSGSDSSWGSSWSSSNSSSYSSSSSSNYDGEWDFETVMVVVIMIGVYMLFRMRSKKNRPQGGRPPAQTQVADNTREISAAIAAIDPAFSAEQFLAFAKEVYITLQQAWMARDWETVRLFEKDTLYRQHELQLQEYVKLGRINVIERINVNQAFLHRYLRDSALEHLTVYMRVRMIDYIIDEKTRQVLKGQKDVDCHLEYLLTFERKNGVTSAASPEQAQVIACPHCGAPTKVTSSGKCEYCDFIVSTIDYGWVLADISGISPGSAPAGAAVTIQD